MGKRKKTKGIRVSDIDVRKVLGLFRANSKDRTVPELMRALNFKKQHRRALVQTLENLVTKGKLVRTRGAYKLTERMQQISGHLQVQRSGIGFVIPDDPRHKDIFISERNFGDAWHNDRVLAAVVRQRCKKNSEGRILRVLSRGQQSLAVLIIKKLEEKKYLCRPTEPRMGFSLLATTELGKQLKPGTLALLIPGDKIDSNLWSGVITTIFGHEQNVCAQEAVTKNNHSIPTAFPEDALQQVHNLPTTPENEDIKKRRDLRSMNFVTIDGQSARDFDDAICVEKQVKGWRLWVAIADVSHYVPQGSPLDKEALERGNSYYFPLSVEPMLPEKLSNGLCSLNPNVDRLAMLVCMDFSSHGVLRKSDFFPAVIQSKARLSYEQVNQAVLKRKQDMRQELQHVIEMLDQAELLARKLSTQRKKRGSLDFELPEAEIKINAQGKVLSVCPRQRNYAHSIIEECMIAANEAVAQYLSKIDSPCLYRIHPEADTTKLSRLYKILQKTGLELEEPQIFSPTILQTLIAQVAGTELEFLVNRLLLRSMKQALYRPENEGHFGLASEYYCHFTSPIRRYADLIVHRLLKISLGISNIHTYGQGQLKEIAEKLYATERKAVDAEREMDKRAAALYLTDHLGETFDGVISFMAEYGFWVELIHVAAEGLIRVQSLNNDYYAYFKDREIFVGERTGKSFRLGQKITVQVKDVNLAALEIEFALIPEESKK